jgi:hypothetical protein
VRKRIYVGLVDPLAGTDLMLGTRYSATCEIQHQRMIKKRNTKERRKQKVQ